MGSVWTVGRARANGRRSTSGIADFDQVVTSVQELLRLLDGPTQRLFKGNVPQRAAEEIARWFQVDMVAILWTAPAASRRWGASVSGRAGRAPLIVVAATSSRRRPAAGPRLGDHDELARLAQTGLEDDQADSIALVPLVRDQVGFGVLVAGRRRTDERVVPLTDRELQEIADSMPDIMMLYVWAWLLLRNLKLRLGMLQ
jgi:hypothetical protein